MRYYIMARVDGDPRLQYLGDIDVTCRKEATIYTQMELAIEDAALFFDDFNDVSEIRVFETRSKSARDGRVIHRAER